MSAHPSRRLWLRVAAAAAACVTALASGATMVAAGDDGTAAKPTPTLHAIPDRTTVRRECRHLLTEMSTVRKPTPAERARIEACTKILGGGNGQGGGGKPKPVVPPVPPPAPPPHVQPGAKPAAASAHPARTPASPAHSTPSHPAPAHTTRVMVDSSDPAPFANTSALATDSVRVLPVESLGPLSGISFGGGLLIWPLLLAVDLLALAGIARVALRRRLVSPEE